MFGLRIINLDRREYIEINGIGTLITYNGSVPASKKGTNWSSRQSTRSNNYYHSSSENSYASPVIMYGYMLLTSKTINEEFKDFAENNQAKGLNKLIGSWNGSRIIMEYGERNSSYTHSINNYDSLTDAVKQLGNMYLKFDKVLK
tara:strand:+ start:88 stop:522 length:435 start_codon:yes stop_codon:yes gene_type:complete